MSDTDNSQTTPAPILPPEPPGPMPGSSNANDKNDPPSDPPAGGLPPGLTPVNPPVVVPEPKRAEAPVTPVPPIPPAEPPKPEPIPVSSIPPKMTVETISSSSADLSTKTPLPSEALAKEGSSLSGLAAAVKATTTEELIIHPRPEADQPLADKDQDLPPQMKNDQNSTNEDQTSSETKAEETPKTPKKKSKKTKVILGVAFFLLLVLPVTAYYVYQHGLSNLVGFARPTPTVSTSTLTTVITVTLTPTDTPPPTPSPIPQSPYCDASCGTDSDCPSGLICSTVSGVKRCRNSACVSYTNCTCPETPTPTTPVIVVTTTPGPTVIAQAPVPKTPVSGTPSVLGASTIAGGIILLLLGLLL